MRVRFEMAGATSFPAYQAECDLTDANAHKLFKRLKENQYCCWGELVAEEPEEGGYMNILDSFENKDARKLYKVKLEMDRIMKEIFC